MKQTSAMFKHMLCERISQRMAEQERSTIAQMFAVGFTGILHLEDDELFELAKYYLDNTELVMFFPYAIEGVEKDDNESYEKTKAAMWHPWDDEYDDEENVMASAHRELMQRREAAWQPTGAERLNPQPKVQDGQVFCPAARTG